MPKHLPLAEYPDYRPGEDPRQIAAQRERMRVLDQTRSAMARSRAARLSLQATMKASEDKKRRGGPA